MALLESSNFAVGGASITIGSALGYLKSPDGVKFTPTVEHYFAGEIEQLTTPPAAFTTDEDFEIAFTLTEMIQSNMIIALGTDNAFTDVPPDVLVFGDNQFTPVKSAVVATGIEAGTAFVRTLTLHACILTTPGELLFSKTQRQEAALVYKALFDDVTNDRVGVISDAGA